MNYFVIIYFSISHCIQYVCVWGGLGFMSTSQKAELSGDTEPKLRKCLNQIGLGNSVVHFVD